MNSKIIACLVSAIITFGALPFFVNAESNIGLTMAPILAASRDRVPDPFSFASKTNVQRNSTVTSDPIIVSGINVAVEISISNGSYSIDGAAFTSAKGLVTNGQTVTVRAVSSPEYSTGVTATLTIGGVSGNFTVRTMAEPDLTPDPFSFPAKTNVALNTLIISDSITVSGINASTPISVTNGAYSIGGAVFTSAAGTVTNGQTVRVRVRSSAAYLTSATATLTMGGVSAQFQVTTMKEPDDPVPGPFSFTAKSGVARNAWIVSDAITVSGINVPSPVSITNGQYSIDSGTFTGTAGTVENGQTVRVRVLSPSDYFTSKTATLTIGGVSGDFKVTTAEATTILTNHTHYVADGAYRVVGEIQNDSPDHLRYVQVSAKLFNSNAQLITTASAYINLNNLEPGEKTCFKLSFSNSNGASYYEFEPSSYWTDGAPAPGNLTVYNDSGQYSGLMGWYDIMGSVRNDSDRNVTNVKPVGTLYNASGKVIGCESTYVNGTDLAKGQSASFNVHYTGRDYNDAASYRIQVDAN